MIHASKNTKLHWNYFLALEDDLEKLSRYIELCHANLPVFSIELAHLLFAAASEVDVLAKCVCDIMAPSVKPQNIDGYRQVLTDPANVPARFQPISEILVIVPRYGLAFTPWENWATGKNPDWWRGYNHVKHQRDEHFQEATLQNALNALGALLILNLYYYRCELSPVMRPPPKQLSSEGLIPPKIVTRSLKPETKLLRLPTDYYDIHSLPPF